MDWKGSLEQNHQQLMAYTSQGLFALGWIQLKMAVNLRVEAVLHVQRHRRVPEDSCQTAACRCTWWICRSLGETAALCECGSTGMCPHSHTYWGLPTRLHVSHWGMVKICICVFLDSFFYLCCCGSTDRRNPGDRDGGVSCIALSCSFPTHTLCLATLAPH